MEDVAPSLIEKVRESFQKKMAADQELLAALEAIVGGSEHYTDALNFSDCVGKAFSGALCDQLLEGVLPDDTLYYNIATRLMDDVGGTAYDLSAQAALQVQTNINSAAGIGMKAVSPDTKVSRLYGLVQAVSGKSISDALPILACAAQELPQGAASDTIKANANFQGKSGLYARIVRKTTGHCCKWCTQQAGTYSYPDVPEDVYRRHSNCRCTVDYYPGKGLKTQNVWSRDWTTKEDKDRAERLKSFSEPVKTHGVSPDTSRQRQPEPVMTEYLRNATPGVGSITREPGYTESRHMAEIKTAQWLHENLGGDIVLLTESTISGEMRPDYLWKGAMWDLKTSSSEKSANSAIRHGLKQIADNPGGIILNFEDRTVSMNNLLEVISKRMSFSVYKNDVDILVMQNNKLVSAMRYKKR